MSSFLSNKFLKFRDVPGAKSRDGSPQSNAIERDLLCAGCGYNLRGLNYGRNCPECGEPITRKSERDSLASGDWSDRQRVRTALALLCFSLFAAAFSRLAIFIILLFLYTFGAGRVYVMLGTVLALLWTIGAWIVTEPRLDKTHPRLRSLRISARLLQLLWVPAYVCWLISQFWPGTSFGDALDVTSIIARVIASLGAGMLMYLLMRIADDAELEDATRRIYIALWALPVPSLLLMLVADSMPWIFMIPIGFILLAWCWFMIVLARGVLEMQRYVAWSMRLAADRTERQSRTEFKRQELEREAAAKVRSLPTEHGDIPMDR